MPRHYSNIEPHPIHRDHYTGYAHGAWRVKRYGPSEWRAWPVAESNKARFIPFTRPRLRDINTHLVELNAQPR